MDAFIAAIIAALMSFLFGGIEDVLPPEPDPVVVEISTTTATYPTTVPKKPALSCVPNHEWILTEYNRWACVQIASAYPTITPENDSEDQQNPESL
jgi:hypothetical protein